jgi:Smg protein
MIDILVYLFENYLPEAYPEPTALAKKLSAAGFEEDEISAALHWLAGLEQAQDVTLTPRSPDARSLRVYSATEEACLSTECRSLLTFLEQAEAIDHELREMIVDRALALGEGVSIGKLKVIVLVVMWRRQHTLDALLLEELLSDEDDEPVYH